MNSKVTFSLAASAAFLALTVACAWFLYAVYEAPARRAAELQAEMRSEYLEPQLDFGESYVDHQTVDGKALQGN